MPFIGPGKGECAGASVCEHGANLPIERFSLGHLAVATTVQTNLCHHQRSLVGEVLQPRQVGIEGRLSLQINIEADDIEEWQLQVFGRRIVNISEETCGIFCLRGEVES